MTTGTIFQVGGANFSKPGMTWVPKTTSAAPSWARFFGGESSLLQAATSQDISANSGTLLGTPVINANSLTCLGANVNGIITNFYPQAATALTVFMACQIPTWVSGTATTYGQLVGNTLDTAPASFTWNLNSVQSLTIGATALNLNFIGGAALTPASPKLYAFVYRPGVNQQVYDLTNGTTSTAANTNALSTQGAPLKIGAFGPGLSNNSGPNNVFHASMFAADLTAFGSGSNTDFLNVVAQIRYILLNKSGITV
jgi:hypothetical protein